MLRSPRLTYPLGKTSRQSQKHYKASSPSRARLELGDLCIGKECSGPQSEHLVVVRSALSPKAGHGLGPVLMVSSIKEQTILSLVI